MALLLVTDSLGGENRRDLARDDGRSRGSPRAPVTLIEYSDFTCGFCVRFFRETWPRIRAHYVDSGKVRFVYRDYPRASEGPGLEAALAARCAGDQGRYWQMHDRLFGSGGTLASPEFQRHAITLGLDRDAFATCLRDAPYTREIFLDRKEGYDLGFRGTPGFALVRTDGSREESPILLPGALPFEVFQEQIERLLNRVKREG
ncbi:MAG: DsbA family protein [Nitrospiraceae bacterium]